MTWAQTVHYNPCFLPAVATKPLRNRRKRQVRSSRLAQRLPCSHRSQAIITVGVALAEGAGGEHDREGVPSATGIARLQDVPRIPECRAQVGGDKLLGLVRDGTEAVWAAAAVAAAAVVRVAAVCRCRSMSPSCRVCHFDPFEVPSRRLQPRSQRPQVNRHNGIRCRLLPPTNSSNTARHTAGTSSHDPVVLPGGSRATGLSPSPLHRKSSSPRQLRAVHAPSEGLSSRDTAHHHRRNGAAEQCRSVGPHHLECLQVEGDSVN